MLITVILRGICAESSGGEGTEDMDGKGWTLHYIHLRAGSIICTDILPKLNPYLKLDGTLIPFPHLTNPYPMQTSNLP